MSLADKLDTLFAFFAVDEKPTGSKDPFALRRAAISVATITLKNELRLPIKRAFGLAFLAWVDVAIRRVRNGAAINLAEKQYVPHSLELLRVTLIEDYLAFASTDHVHYFSKLFDSWNQDVRSEIVNFLADRLKVQQREAGVRHDLIDAVFALGGEDDLVRLLARVKALQAFVSTDEGANLLAGYKRAANILKQNPSPLEGEGQRREAAQGEGASAPNFGARNPSPGADAPSSPSRGEGLAVETALLNALSAAEPLAAAAIEREDFAAAMSALASLRAPIDAFFEGVMVNDPDPDKRSFRIGLLTRFRDAVHRVADFSKIEG